MPTNLDKRELEREQLIFRYIRALDRDDDEVIETVLEAALDDHEFAARLDEVDRALLDEAGFPSAVDKATVTALAEHHLGGLDESTLTPLTVGHVAARLKDRNRVPVGAEAINEQLLTCAELVPSILTAASAEDLLHGLGVATHSAYTRAFRNESARLAMSRSQGPARIAARSRRRPKS
ncbi:MAG: hypothetical protein ACE5G0_01095 [Rhodothermales bacterium]